MEQPMALALDISNLNVFYGEDCALRDVNLQVEEREFLAIIGPNGGGKTTLLKSILGLVQPDSGEIRLFGRTGASARRGCDGWGRRRWRSATPAG